MVFLMQNTTNFEDIFSLDLSEFPLSPVQQLMLFHLAYRADDYGYISCTTTDLSSWCGCSRPVISKSVQVLNEFGLISVSNSGGFSSRNTYQLLLNRNDVGSFEELFIEEKPEEKVDPDEVIKRLSKEFSERSSRPSIPKKPVSKKRMKNRAKRKNKRK